jgi:hypothetical protein
MGCTRGAGVFTKLEYLILNQAFSIVATWRQADAAQAVMAPTPGRGFERHAAVLGQLPPASMSGSTPRPVALPMSYTEFV